MVQEESKKFDWDNWKQTTKRLEETQIWIKRFKVESWSKFGRRLESHHTVQKRQVARLKQRSNWFNSSFKKLLESGRTEVCEWKDIKPGQVEDTGSEAWQLICWLQKWLIKVHVMLKSWLENVYGRKKWILQDWSLVLFCVHLLYRLMRREKKVNLDD